MKHNPLSEAILAVTDATKKMCYNLREMLGLFCDDLVAKSEYVFIRKNLSHNCFCH